MSSIASSNSTAAPLTLLPLNTLKIKQSVAERAVFEIARTHFDYQSSILGHNGFVMNGLRAVEIERVDLKNDKDAFICPISSYSNNKDFLRVGFLKLVNKVYLTCQQFWLNVLDLLKNSQNLAATCEAVHLLGNNLTTLLGDVHQPQMRIVEDDDHTRYMQVRVTRTTGLPPCDYKYTEKRPVNPGWTFEETLTDSVNRFNFIKGNYYILLFDNDPQKREFRVIPVSMQKFKPPQNVKSPAQTWVSMTHFKLEPIKTKMADEVERYEKRALKFMYFLKLEQEAVEKLLTNLKSWNEVNQQITDLPKSEIEPSTSHEGHQLTNETVQKQKKVKLVHSENPVVVEPVAQIKEKPVIQPPMVIIDDKDAFHTFQTLIGSEKNKVTWNEIKHCLAVIGFEITQPHSGGNTWKFKWINQAWLRDELSPEELANEPAPQNRGNSSRAFHTPHHNGLSSREPLDHGRLSSFKKLLDECHFTCDSVKLKEGTL